MFQALANPQRFMSFSRWAAPALGAVAAVLLLAGLWLAFTAPEDYQQGDTVRIMFIHVPAAWLGMFAYACLGGASFFGLVFRHALADAAARACAPLGAAFTGGLGAALALGSRRGGLLIAVIVLPLFAPPVIFGAGAIDAFAAGLKWTPGFLLLCAYSLASAGLTPFAMAAACRNALS